MSAYQDGVRARLTKFFADNPDEELTMQKIADKYDVGIERVRDVVVELCQTGQLEHVRVVRARQKGIAK